jgi:hypothetical protein
LVGIKKIGLLGGEIGSESENVGLRDLVDVGLLFAVFLPDRGVPLATVRARLRGQGLPQDSKIFVLVN